MGLGKTGGECADGCDVKGKSPTILAPAKIPKGMLSIKNTSNGLLFSTILLYFHNISHIQRFLER